MESYDGQMRACPGRIWGCLKGRRKVHLAGGGWDGTGVCKTSRDSTLSGFRTMADLARCPRPPHNRLRATGRRPCTETQRMLMYLACARTLVLIPTTMSIRDADRVHWTGALHKAVIGATTSSDSHWWSRGGCKGPMECRAITDTGAATFAQLSFLLVGFWQTVPW